jgi:hypothetical protein
MVTLTESISYLLRRVTRASDVAIDGLQRPASGRPSEARIPSPVVRLAIVEGSPRSIGARRRCARSAA